MSKVRVYRRHAPVYFIEFPMFEIAHDKTPEWARVEHRQVPDEGSRLTVSPAVEPECFAITTPGHVAVLNKGDLATFIAACQDLLDADEAVDVTADL